MFDEFLNILKKHNNEFTEKLNTEFLQTYNEIIDKYSENIRFYHNLKHIEEMFFLFNFYKSSFLNSDSIFLAILFHDVIYNPSQKDNELQSAEYAQSRLKSLNVEKKTIEIVYNLILSTQKHALFYNNIDNKLFLDFDLAILSAKKERYVEYKDSIRKEYSFVFDFIYKMKRKEVLHNFLKREYIYYSDEFKSNCENIARENILFEISLL